MATYLEDDFSDHLLPFTDTSVNHKRNSATVATVIPALGYDSSGRFSIVTSTRIVELAAVRLALKKFLLLGPLGKVLLVSGSSAVLLELKNEDRGSILACAITVLCWDAENPGCFPSFQREPSQCGISGHVHADALTASAHSQSQTIDIDRFFKAHKLIDETLRR